VQFYGSTAIRGGTLNQINGFLGTPQGNTAILDGSTGAGAVTINGTYQWTLRPSLPQGFAPVQANGTS
jgi:hypothetical protein